MPRSCRRGAIFPGSQLIVGRAGDHPRTNARHALAVEHPAEGTGRQDIHIQRQNLINSNRRNTEFVFCAGNICGIDVGPKHPGALGAQERGQMETHMTQALHGDTDAIEIIAAQNGIQGLGAWR